MATDDTFKPALIIAPPRTGFQAQLAAATQSLPNNVTTLIDNDTVVFDEHGDYDAVLKRHVPIIPGRYFYGSLQRTEPLTLNTAFHVLIFKNGVEVMRVERSPAPTNSNALEFVGGPLEMDGVGDFVDVRIFHQNGSALNAQGQQTRFSNFYGFKFAEL